MNNNKVKIIPRGVWINGLCPQKLNLVGVSRATWANVHLSPLSFLSLIYTFIFPKKNNNNTKRNYVNRGACVYGSTTIKMLYNDIFKYRYKSKKNITG